jgi:K+-transporting ATPase ATPase C chain
MKKELIIALRATLVTLVVTGLAYPLAVTGAAQVLFAGRASGSLVTDERNQVVGSELIGQGFSSPSYFQSRPSAAGDNGWDAANSSGSNLGPTSKKLRDAVKERVAKLHAENPDARGDVPAELVTQSASGLDPHLSPEAAAWQAPRIAKARGVAVARVTAVVDELTEGRDLGVFGEPRANVLMLNLALDRRFGRAVNPSAAPQADLEPAATAPGAAPTPPPKHD